MAKNLVPPTDSFIASIAKKYNMKYTLGKKGEDRFYSDDGNPIYPLNDGAIGEEDRVILLAGTVISRYGQNSGRYASPRETTLEARALPRKARSENDLHVFVLKKDIECYRSIVAPWFCQKGKGIQYRFLSSVSEMMDRGALSEKKT